MVNSGIQISTSSNRLGIVPCNPKSNLDKDRRIAGENKERMTEGDAQSSLLLHVRKHN